MKFYGREKITYRDYDYYDNSYSYGCNYNYNYNDEDNYNCYTEDEYGGEDDCLV